MGKKGQDLEYINSTMAIQLHDLMEMIDYANPSLLLRRWQVTNPIEIKSQASLSVSKLHLLVLGHIFSALVRWRRDGGRGLL